MFFPTLDLKRLEIHGVLQSRVLIVAPGKSLPWSYHLRFAKFWKVLEGRAGAIISDTTEETEYQGLQAGGLMVIEPQKWHRLVGLSEYAVVAEICQDREWSQRF